MGFGDPPGSNTGTERSDPAHLAACASGGLGAHLLCQVSTSEYSDGGAGEVQEYPQRTSTKIQSFSHSLNTRSLASAPSAPGQSVQVWDDPAAGPRALTAAVARGLVSQGHSRQGDGQGQEVADQR